MENIQAKLFEYQKKDRDDMLARKTAILAEQIGAGKTIIAMSVMDALWQQGCLDKVLVVSPNSVIPQWCNMLRDWLDVEPFPVYGGRGKEYRYHQYEWFRTSNDHPVLVVNYSSVRTDVQVLARLGIKGVFLDEASAIKGMDSALAMASRQLCLACDYRYLITGTPIQNNILELFALMQAVEPNVLGQYWWFRSRYCIEEDVPISFGGQYRTYKKIVGYRNLEELAPAVNLYCIRNGYEEVQEKLPEVVVENRYVDLTAAQKIKYHEIRGGILKTQDDWKRVNLLEKAIRLFECCDSLKLLGDSEDRSAKIDEVMDLLEGELRDVGTIVFCQYKIPLRSIAKRLNDRGIASMTIDGDVPVEQRARAQDAFNKGDIKVLLLTTAGEVGLNLQGGSAIIMMDRMYNPAKNAQVIGRINRVGQSKKSIVVVNIIARDTIDETVFRVLKRKTELINDIFQEQDINALGVEQLKCLITGDAEHLI